MSKFKLKLNEFLANLKTKLGKKSQMALAGVLAIVMLIIFFGSIKNNEPEVDNGENVETLATKDYLQSMEERLVKIVSSIKGVGKTQVFLMAETSIEKIYATDTDNSVAGDSESSSTEEIVFSKNGSESLPVVRLEIYPKITGALIVIEGGGDEKLRLMVLNAVSVALSLENSKIEVLEGSAT